MNDGQYLVTLTLSFRFAFATIKYHLGMSVYDIFAVECFLAWNFNVNCYLLIETSKNENLKLPTVTYKITTCEKIIGRFLDRLHRLSARVLLFIIENREEVLA